MEEGEISVESQDLGGVCHTAPLELNEEVWGILGNAVVFQI